MADDSSSPATGNPNSQNMEPTTPIPNPLTTPPPKQYSQPQAAALDPTQAPVFQNVPPGPPYTPSQIPGSLVSSLPPPPSFRPGMQFTPAANFQNPSVPNSGVPPPAVNSGGVMATPGSMPPIRTNQAQSGQLLNPPGMRPFPPMANGYPGIHGVAPPGSMPPPVS